MENNAAKAPPIHKTDAKGRPYVRVILTSGKRFYGVKMGRRTFKCFGDLMTTSYRVLTKGGEPKHEIVMAGDDDIKRETAVQMNHKYGEFEAIK